MGWLERYVTNEDFKLLVALVNEAAAGPPGEMSDVETRASEVFEAALKLECREAGIGSLKEFERLIDADRGKRRTGARHR